ncbi:hypothetical protein FJ970_14945 [Mesorhizobium sp. B2-1-8]|uniref:hypothetical protein n=1 Tax=unclassified Mesorhizobium TaxID=325217 RepID=UPI00112666AD|nr:MULTISPECIES: hypothetical protein [unclassified Mesorhizobium]TPI28657.1 hypothetical protein FJW08_19950 [Mesorhizobium sp. B3-2-1]UCI22169.1 hypothetical protein FJ970_14945 [Mesorhizobium sp. B2-1-8]
MPNVVKFVGVLGTSLLLFSANASAHRVTRFFDEPEVPAGKGFSPMLGCGNEELISGGYVLDIPPANPNALVVSASYPFSDHVWQVVVRNISSEPVAVQITIVVICG